MTHDHLQDINIALGLFRHCPAVLQPHVAPEHATRYIRALLQYNAQDDNSQIVSLLWENLKDDLKDPALVALVSSTAGEVVQDASKVRVPHLHLHDDHPAMWWRPATKHLRPICNLPKHLFFSKARVALSILLKSDAAV